MSEVIRGETLSLIVKPYEARDEILMDISKQKTEELFFVKRLEMNE